MSDEPTYTAAEWARHIASKRKRVVKNCAKCGVEFDGIAKRIYCSGACRVAAFRRAARQPEGSDRGALRDGS